jgi:phosphatidylserine/phosphatidylglycerophosphate/cardiolipin synthase-like enzyme
VTGRLLDPVFLRDGGQTPTSTAARIVTFIGAAKRSLDIAIYDCDPAGAAGKLLIEAINGAGARGVAVRVAYNIDEPDYAGAPPKTTGDDAFMTALDVVVKPVTEEGALMHHKYVVRDGADILTGSTNWTDDAFSREENAILMLEAVPEIAGAYTANFTHLFEHGHVRGSGATGEVVTLEHGIHVQPYFSPQFLGQVAAGVLSRASRRLRVVSPVITSGAVLGTLAEFAGRESFDFDGAYDATQMREVEASWKKVPWNRWKIEAFRSIAPRLSGKISTPWSPGALHDYMHAKFVVSDDEVLTGSYNLSRHGEENAENVLHIVGEYQAQLFAGFADEVAAKYRREG